VRVLLVSRHPGVQDWFSPGTYAAMILQWGDRGSYGAIERIAHLPEEDIDLLGPGDIVVGTLPIQLAARVCGRDAIYVHLSLRVPPELRGTELTAEMMDACDAHLQRYEVRATEPGESLRNRRILEDETS